MIYRKFDKLDIKTSLLGFGCMRFPTLKDGKIDETDVYKRQIAYDILLIINWFMFVITRKKLLFQIILIKI